MVHQGCFPPSAWRDEHRVDAVCKVHHQPLGFGLTVGEMFFVCRNAIYKGSYHKNDFRYDCKSTKKYSSNKFISNKLITNKFITNINTVDNHIIVYAEMGVDCGVLRTGNIGFM